MEYEYQPVTVQTGKEERQPTSWGRKWLERVKYGREKSRRLEVVRDAAARQQAREAEQTAKLQAQAEARQADYAEKLQANRDQEGQFNVLREQLQTAAASGDDITELVAQVVTLWREAMQTTTRLQTLSSMQGAAWPMPDWVRTLNIWVSELERGRQARDLFTPQAEEMSEDVKLSELVDASGQKLFPEEPEEPFQDEKYLADKQQELGAAQAADYEAIMEARGGQDLAPLALLERVAVRLKEEQLPETQLEETVQEVSAEEDNSVYYNTQAQDLTPGEPIGVIEEDDEQEPETVYYNTQTEDTISGEPVIDDQVSGEVTPARGAQENEIDEVMTALDQQAEVGAQERPDWLRAETETVLTDDQVWDLLASDPKLEAIWQLGRNWQAENARPAVVLNADLETYVRATANRLVHGHNRETINEQVQPLAAQLRRLLRMEERAGRAAVQAEMNTVEQPASGDLAAQILAENRAKDDLSRWMKPDQARFTQQQKALRAAWRAAHRAENAAD